MTIGGWIIFGFLSVFILIGGMYVVKEYHLKQASVFICLLVCIALILSIFFGMKWYFNNTASGQRALTDQVSNLRNGLQRTITVYTADGNVIAQYTGKIDIDTNDGGYVKFDFDGKRYIYYNCFVESIADIW